MKLHLKSVTFVFMLIGTVVSPVGGTALQDPEPPVHTFKYSGQRCVLRAPLTTDEWQNYHDIRKAEIHDRYCQGKIYKPNSKEELLSTNFRFVLLDQSSGALIGTIRVDFHAPDEASFRWVAIEKNHQRHGFGQEMMGLAEAFVADQKRKVIRIPAATDSQAFYEKLGYQNTLWPDGPDCVGTVPLMKELGFATKEENG
jgi:N-acetylglutamate synthase-like GNAT family acetyltransferase